MTTTMINARNAMKKFIFDDLFFLIASDSTEDTEKSLFKN